MTGLRIEGTEEFHKLAARVKDAGDKKLRTATGKAIRDVAKPAGKRILGKAAESMPQRGGLAAKIASGSIGVRSSYSGSRAQVSLLLKAHGYDLNPLERGELRHPVYGNRKSWVRQSVPANRFTEAFEAEAPRVRAEVLKAAQGVLNDVARGI